MIALAPIAAAARLAGHPGRVLCHAAGDGAAGRASVLAADPSATLTVWPDRVEHRDAGGLRTSHGDPIAAIDGFLTAHGCALADRGPPVRPRVLGFLGYDLGRAIERLGARPPGPAVPDAWLAAYPAVVCWRDGAGPGAILADDPAAAAALAGALARDAVLGSPPRFGAPTGADDARWHGGAVDAIRGYIERGDVYQVNLARRLRWPIEDDGDALALYAALHAVAPAAYGAVIEAGAVRVVSGSPECFLTRRGERLVTAPIKGTRPRTGEVARDRALAADLAAHPKDAAEHLMIVDLERNDLGRIAAIGSVTVDELGTVVALPGLYHKVSTVSATPRPGATWADVLRATFPGGSITGAPKIRAMQLIDELEPVARGPYCGALGWWGDGGAVDLAIAIRIGVLTGGELLVHVGGGIVADSERAAELAETDDKAAGWRAALTAVACRART